VLAGLVAVPEADDLVAQLDAADVDHRPPDPALQALHPTEVAPGAEDTREPLLDRVPPTLAVAEHRHRHPEELPVAISIHLLDCSDELVVRKGTHHEQRLASHAECLLHDRGARVHAV
jgi:hypothetical protein